MVLCLALSYMISLPVLALDSETRAIKRQLMTLHNAIKLSSANLSLLQQHAKLSSNPIASDNLTVLAALEAVASAKGEEIAVSEANLASARLKIESYDNLCQGVKEHESIYSDYCKFRPYAELYASYMEMLKGAN